MSETSSSISDAMTSPEGLALAALLKDQKESFRRNPDPSVALRLERLGRLKKSLKKFEGKIIEAINLDFNGRSTEETRLAELMTCIDLINYYSRHLPEWTRPQDRHTSILHQPAKTWVQYQPLGVVGIMAPWNYPLALSVGPLICALAAGNHAMIKISSASTHFGKVVQDMLNDTFPKNVVAVVDGGGRLNDIFCHLPFNLMVFTGSPSVGRTVMAAAAQNLVPVILELGGKSPALLSDKADMADAAKKIAFGKFWNAGQTCIAPDYAQLPRGATHTFIRYMQENVNQMYPSLATNPDYSSIINDRQYRRLQDYLADARSKGAHIIEINPGNEDLSGTRKIAPTLVTQVTPDMKIAQEEIFGPILPVLEYDHLKEAIDHINLQPRPLAMYYFDADSKRAAFVEKQTHSGHFGINSVLSHFAQDDLPFGGVGNSGMGRYHGFEGFVSMSNTRSVMEQGPVWPTRLMLAPFKPAKKLAIKTLVHSL